MQSGILYIYIYIYIAQGQTPAQKFNKLLSKRKFGTLILLVYYVD